MKEELNKNYQVIEEFIKQFTENDRLMSAVRIPSYEVSNGHDGLKEADKICHEVVENNFSKNPDILKIISHNNKEEEWLKKLIINYTILRIYHYATAWNILQDRRR